VFFIFYHIPEEDAVDVQVLIQGLHTASPLTTQLCNQLVEVQTMSTAQRILSQVDHHDGSGPANT